MNKDEGLQVMNVLLAYYPTATLEPDSVEAFVDTIMAWEFQPAMEAVKGWALIEHRFPSLAELREAYFSHRRVYYAKIADSRGLDEPQWAPPPDEWYDLGQRLGAKTERREDG